MRQILSILAMTWALAVSAQTATQNYVLSQTMLDDHQGNNRLVMSEDGIVEQVNDYTPFGVQMKNSFAETSDQRYKYNGKELDRMLGLDLYDYGARFYDARIARWQTIDPLCEKYYSISPYAYCANNPIRFIDPDGKVIIFINGQNNGDGGTPAYWDGIDKTIKNGLGEKKALYYDGSSGGWDNTKKALKGLNSNLNVKYRIAAGREKGYKEAANIINSLGRGEKINFVSHSMGSAYTKGFIQGMLDYASKNDIDTSNLFGFELDLAPFQPKDQKAIKGVDTWVIQHQFDGVAGTGDMLDADIEVSHTDLPFYKLINLITFF
jgi:RHS repeat-associated protein